MMKDERGRQVVTGLGRLLKDVPLDTLFAHMQHFGLSWSVSGKGGGSCKVVIYKDGLPRYHGGGGNGPKAALAAALANFYADTNDRDFHDIEGSTLTQKDPRGFYQRAAESHEVDYR